MHVAFFVKVAQVYSVERLCYGLGHLYFSTAETATICASLRITLCTVSDNEGIPILLCGGCDDMVDFNVCCLLFAHVRSDDRQPNIIFCRNSTEKCKPSFMLLKKSFLYVCKEMQTKFMQFGFVSKQ